MGTTVMEGQTDLRGNSNRKYRRRYRIAALLSTLAVLGSCETGESEATSPRELKVSGQLVTGSAVEGVRGGIRGGVRAGQQEGVRAGALRDQTAVALGAPLPGFSLYCVTFEDPPHAGKGTADADGNFTLNLDAKDVSFGCFVLDQQGVRVADLSFVGDFDAAAGGHRLGGTARLESDTNLGEVWVDSFTQVALAGATARKGTDAEDLNINPTGTWMFGECLDAQSNDPCSGNDLVAHRLLTAAYPSVYLNRVSGQDLTTGERRYLLDLWISRKDFLACGGTEGITENDARSQYDLILDPGVPARPFTYSEEPPGPNSWDPQDTCTGPSLSPSDPPVKCSTVTDRGLQAHCYARCWLGRSKLTERDFSNCALDRFHDFTYMDGYLENILAGQPPDYDESRFLLYTGRPVLAIGNASGRIFTLVYSDPNTFSATQFYPHILNVASSNLTDPSKVCVGVNSIQINASFISETRGIATVSISQTIDRSSRDYEWCVKNVTLIWGLPVGAPVRGRVFADVLPGS